MPQLWIVRLIEQGHAYGPFADPKTADAFADYLTAEVDPAEVRPLGDPTLDLLNWRTNFLESLDAVGDPE